MALCARMAQVLESHDKALAPAARMFMSIWMFVLNSASEP